MSEENVSQEFRLKNIDETRKNLVEEINWNELTSEKHRKVYRTLKLYWTLYCTFYNY